MTQLTLRPASDALLPRQQWWLRPLGTSRSCDAAAADGAGRKHTLAQRLPSDLYALESAAMPGLWLSGRLGGASGSGAEQTASLERVGRGGPTSVPTEAAVLRLRAPVSEYPPLALWAHSNLSVANAATRVAAQAGAPRHYLMLPLNSLVDEHYSAYLCVGAGMRPLPRFCE